MDFVSVASVVALSLAIYVFLHYITSHPRRCLPPGPTGWPIIGNLHLLTGPDPPHQVFSKLADRYGPIIHLRAGSKHIVVISSPEAARECLTVHDQAFASRPAIAAGRILGFGFNIIAFAPYGPYWREARKLANLHFLSSSHLLALSDVQDEATRSLVAGIGKSCSVSGVSGIRIRDHLIEMVMTNVLKAIGKRRFDFAGPGERRELIELIEASFSRANPVVGDVFPGLKWADMGGKEREMEEVAARIRAMTKKWVEERRKMEKVKEEDMDFMDVVISTVDEKKMSSPSASGQADDDLVIVGLLQSIIFGTVETTTTTLEWALSELLNNQGALKILQQEIDSNIGLQRKVEETDTKDLHYLQAVVKETLRLHLPGPLLVPHESTEDCNAMGYHIPAGTQLVINAWKIQRDPRWWTRPLEFEPERFVGPHGTAAEVDLWGRHFQLIPFGAGRRACPGAALAVNILHLTIARLFHAFEWKLPARAGATTAALDMREGPGLTAVKAVPLVVELAPRDFFTLYS